MPQIDPPKIPARSARVRALRRWWPDLTTGELRARLQAEPRWPCLTGWRLPSIPVHRGAA
jgi:hypothetical protein